MIMCSSLSMARKRVVIVESSTMYGGANAAMTGDDVVSVMEAMGQGQDSYPSGVVTGSMKTLFFDKFRAAAYVIVRSCGIVECYVYCMMVPRHGYCVVDHGCARRKRVAVLSSCRSELRRACIHWLPFPFLSSSSVIKAIAELDMSPLVTFFPQDVSFVGHAASKASSRRSSRRRHGGSNNSGYGDPSQHATPCQERANIQAVPTREGGNVRDLQFPGCQGASGGQTFHVVPCSREGVARCPSLSLLEKRKMISVLEAISKEGASKGRGHDASDSTGNDKVMYLSDTTATPAFKVL